MERNRLGVTVRDALTLEAFSGTKVVAGEAGLDRRIYHINVMEVPDILDWVQEGELLLTTFYSLRANPEEVVALIPELAKKNLAGLAIKPKRYIQEIPKKALEIADQLQFPILKLPPHIAFSTVLEPIINEIFNFQTDLLRRSEWVHNQFIEVVLQGGGLDRLTEMVETLIAKEVVVVDARIRPLGPVSAWMAQWMEGIDWDCFKNAVRLTKIEGKQPGIVVPLLAGGSLLGYLVTASNPGRSHEEYSILDEITLERAATVATLEIINARALNEMERRFRNEFVVDLVEAAFPSNDVAKQRAKANNWTLENEMRVYLIRLVDFQRQRQKDSLLHYLRDNLDSRYISGELGRDIVLVSPAGEQAARLSDWLQKRFGELEAAAGSGLIIGAGRDSTSLRDVKTSFRQAKRAVSNAQNIPSLGKIVHYDQLGIYRLLEELNGKAEMRAFIRDTLQPLLDYDRRNGTDLLKTLRHYYSEGGNLKQVAAGLFVHYNTVLYRMKRIEELLGISMDNPQQRLALEVAVKALVFQ